MGGGMETWIFFGEKDELFSKAALTPTRTLFQESEVNGLWL